MPVPVPKLRAPVAPVAPLTAGSESHGTVSLVEGLTKLAVDQLVDPIPAALDLVIPQKLRAEKRPSHGGAGSAGPDLEPNPQLRTILPDGAPHHEVRLPALEKAGREFTRAQIDPTLPGLSLIAGSARASTPSACRVGRRHPAARGGRSLSQFEIVRRWYCSSRTVSLMKLAEALAERADAQKRLEQLRSRAQAAARYQEGEEPVEDANALLAEADGILVRLEELIRRINRTNSSQEIEPGVTITDAIARRDVLRLRRALYAGLADAAAGQQARGEWQSYAPVRQMRSELRYLSAVDVPALRRMADEVAKEHRELDTRVQQANWEVDLAD